MNRKRVVQKLNKQCLILVKWALPSVPLRMGVGSLAQYKELIHGPFRVLYPKGGKFEYGS